MPMPPMKLASVVRISFCCSWKLFWRLSSFNLRCAPFFCYFGSLVDFCSDLSESRGWLRDDPWAVCLRLF